MNELHRNRTFSYTGGNALHRSGAHVSGDKDAWYTGFEQERIPIQGPSFRSLTFAMSGGARQDKALLIPLYYAW